MRFGFIVVLTVFALLSALVSCKELRAKWIHAFGSLGFTSSDSFELGAVTQDSFGFSYTTGRFFVYPAQFGKIKVEGSNTPSLFVAKHDKTTGEILWVRLFKATHMPSTPLLQADTKNHVLYISTAFNGTLSFPNGEKHLSVLHTSSLLLKMDLDGTVVSDIVFQAVQTVDIPDFPETSNSISSLQLGADQLVYVSGKFTQKMEIGSHQLSNDASFSAGFIARVAQDLQSADWLVSVLCTDPTEAGDVIATRIAVDSTRVYLFGEKRCNVVLEAQGSETPLIITFHNIDGDNYLAALNSSSGRAIWGNCLGSFSGKQSPVLGLTLVNNNAEVFLAISFSADARLATGVAFYKKGGCNENYLVAKYKTATGELSWNNQVFCNSTSTAQLGTKLSLTSSSSSGRMMLVGYYKNNIQFSNGAALSCDDQQQFLISLDSTTGALVFSAGMNTDVPGSAQVREDLSSSGSFMIAGDSSTVSYPLSVSTPVSRERMYLVSFMILEDDQVCPAGTYGLAPKNCTSCPSGTANSHRGALVISNCLVCGNNTSSNPERTECVPISTDLPLYMIVVIIGIVFATAAITFILCAMTSQILKAAGITAFSRIPE